METKTLEIDRADLEIEEWRSVVGYEGFYSVSNMGRVRRDRGGRGTRAKYILKASQLSNSGYLKVGLVRDGKQETKTVHSLVAEAFLGPKPKGLSVNHKDGKKLNNSPNNLEYLSLSDNAAHALKIGLCPPRATHCHKDHPFDENNTLILKDGQRVCRSCARERNRHYKVRVRQSRGESSENERRKRCLGVQD